jgi:hypothetical protein
MANAYSCYQSYVRSFSWHLPFARRQATVIAVRFLSVNVSKSPRGLVGLLSRTFFEILLPSATTGTDSSEAWTGGSRTTAIGSSEKRTEAGVMMMMMMMMMGAMIV